MKRIVYFITVAMCALAACTANNDDSTNKVKILAHRGLCTTGNEFTTDENTLDALKRAQEAGVDGVEFDVHLTADGKLVIRHDNKIDEGLSCQGSDFEDIRAYLLPFGNRIPTLGEWLDQAKQTPQIKMMLELKSHPAEKEKQVITMCLDEIRKRDMIDQMYMLSFNPETLDEVLRQEPEMKVILNSNSLHHSMVPEEVKAHGFHAVSYNVSVILNHTDWLPEFKKYGIETYLWMVEDGYLRGIAEQLGFTWVTTDFYDVVKYTD